MMIVHAASVVLCVGQYCIEQVLCFVLDIWAAKKAMMSKIQANLRKCLSYEGNLDMEARETSSMSNNWADFGHKVQSEMHMSKRQESSYGDAFSKFDTVMFAGE